MSGKTALLVGATGVVGRRLLQKLLFNSSFDKIITIVRKPSNVKYEKLNEHIIDFDKIEEYADIINANTVFSCLGTTMKTAGSKEAFYTVDYTYTIKIAEIASQNGCEQFFVVSALGADAESSIFYNKVKGEMEDALKKIPFKCIGIFRPSILISNRKEIRIGERIGIIIVKALSFLMIGPLRKYKGVRASVVASAMIKLAKQNRTGIHIIESDEIQRIADQ